MGLMHADSHEFSASTDQGIQVGSLPVMSMMMLLSTRAVGSVIASEFVHDFVGGFSAHLIFPDADDGCDALALLDLRKFPFGICDRLGKAGGEDFPCLGFHRALMAGGAETEFLFHAFIQIANREGGAHGGKLSNASIAVNEAYAGVGR